MIDLSHVPFSGKLSPEDQKKFEKRALALDDINDPPIVIDEDGNYTYDDEEKQ